MFPLRQLTSSAVRCLPNVRKIASQVAPLVDLAVDNEGIAVLTMQRLPVNGLNLELLQELSKSLDEVAKNGSKGLILTSASPTVFSAGLDFSEIYKPDPKRIEAFWFALQDVTVKFFGSNYPTAAAINGHAPAGGCILALCTEYRAMVSGKFTIGLNETALGMVVPMWLIYALRHTISSRETEFALTTGRMFGVEEALKVGLIDVTASNKTDAIEKCKHFINKFDKIHPGARAVTKQRVREVVLQRLTQNNKKDLETFLNFIKDDETQASIGAYIQNMKKKKTAARE